MKKNTILYLLLIVLLVMNGFLLINFLGRPDHKMPKESGTFITEELQFNEAQLKQFHIVEDTHHNNMRAIGDEVKRIKDELFEKITEPNISQTTIDSLISLISEKEQLKEKELFKRLRSVYDLCDEDQKERYSEIIKKARRFNHQGPDRPDERARRPKD